MAFTSKQEERALAADEKALVDKSRHPAIKDLSDKDLSELIRNLREKRDRAQTIARQQRREMRGKAAARGAQSASREDGSMLKASVLANAVRRANGEMDRRAD
jgi:ribosomal protein L12E/L44/L45/RPP1/RPP2